jgi:hypothetical protein
MEVRSPDKTASKENIHELNGISLLTIGGIEEFFFNNLSRISQAY